MKISGENSIPVPQEIVWAGLNDPEVLRQSIPGCESLEQIDENSFKATVVTKIGPISARFVGKVELSELDPPHGYTLSGSGSAGAMGNAKGSAVIRLTPQDGNTKLVYDVDADVSGKIAQLGGRLIQSTAGILAGQFFKRFADVVTDGEPESERIGKSQSTSIMPIIVGAVLLLGIAVAAYVFLF